MDQSVAVQRYLPAARAVADLLAAPEVAAGWARASALPGLSVGALAAHLARSVFLVETSLDEAEPVAGETITAAEYFARFGPPPALDDPVNVGIRARSAAGATGGAADVVPAVRACLGRLRERLPAEPDGRRVPGFGGCTLTLAQYLRTRLVEFAVHTDDLALSVGVPTPAGTAAADAVDVLVGTARLRHGDAAVLRALARRERDDVSALRVL